MAKTSEHTKSRHRSPAYPALDLTEAVEKVAVLNKEEKRHAVPVSVAAGHLGYGEITSSSALRGVAALKQFGLVIEEGGGDDRKVRVSPLALEILLATSGEERAAALKKAALLPPLYAKMWKHFGGKLPSDGTLKAYLIKDLGFNDTYVALCLRKFRATIAYANVSEDDTISSGNEPHPGDDLHGEDDMESTVELPAEKPIRQAHPRDDRLGPVVKFDLPRGNMVEIRLRSKLTKAEFATLKKIYELTSAAFLEDSDAEESGDESQEQ